MSIADAARVLRPGLLDGVGVLLAGRVGGAEDRGERLGDAVHDACAGLGARVAWSAPVPHASNEAQEAASDEAVASALESLQAIDMLVVDAAAMFASGPTAQQLGGCLQASWAVTRSVFNLAFLPGERGGRILYLAPPGDAGEHSGAALAGLENLSRTLSIEWSRHRVTAVTIAPGATTGAGELAALVAFLASRAGAYFSGCLLDLRGA